MAIFKYPQYLAYQDEPAFDAIFLPGQAVPISGIYRCEACGTSVTSVKGEPFPPQDHHAHNVQGPVRWRLAVRSNWAR